ncbi:Hypothetical predicted protein [Cloeon dipterum]|uniref:Uncharacterized protein n=1 Tax=Cloeon dipterum TaxID=197152 RepID=A0A8S1DY57_9INSE|nr:Hypothetical predicted protein [Cloeon dipterum]
MLRRRRETSAGGVAKVPEASPKTRDFEYFRAETECDASDTVREASPPCDASDKLELPSRPGPSTYRTSNFARPLGLSVDSPERRESFIPECEPAKPNNPSPRPEGTSFNVDQPQRNASSPDTRTVCIAKGMNDGPRVTREKLHELTSRLGSEAPTSNTD